MILRDIPTRIAGIPALVDISWEPAEPAIDGRPDWGGVPGCSASLYLNAIKDRQGYPAPWLQHKIDNMTQREEKELDARLQRDLAAHFE